MATPAQGTAFDFVGQGKATPDALWGAFRIACDMAETRLRENNRGAA